MPLNTSAIQVGAAAIAADIDGLTLHTGDPGAAGTSNPTTAAKKTVACTASDGVVSVTGVEFTGGAANGPCTYVGYWHGSTFRGSDKLPVTSAQTFDPDGNYTVTSFTVTGTSSAS